MKLFTSILKHKVERQIKNAEEEVSRQVNMNNLYQQNQKM